VTCKYCNTEIADKALICYRCGRATTEPRVTPPSTGSLFEGRRRSRLPIIVAVIAVIILLLVAWLLLGTETVTVPGARRLDDPASIIVSGADASASAAALAAGRAEAFAFAVRVDVLGDQDALWMML
jgi:hypothetical protein